MDKKEQHKTFSLSFISFVVLAPVAAAAVGLDKEQIRHIEQIEDEEEEESESNFVIELAVNVSVCIFEFAEREPKRIAPKMEWKRLCIVWCRTRAHTHTAVRSLATLSAFHSIVHQTKIPSAFVSIN